MRAPESNLSLLRDLSFLEIIVGWMAWGWRDGIGFKIISVGLIVSGVLGAVVVMLEFIDRRMERRRSAHRRGEER